MIFPLLEKQTQGHFSSLAYLKKILIFRGAHYELVLPRQSGYKSALRKTP